MNRVGLNRKLLLYRGNEPLRGLRCLKALIMCLLQYWKPVGVGWPFVLRSARYELVVFLHGLVRLFSVTVSHTQSAVQLSRPLKVSFNVG